MIDHKKSSTNYNLIMINKLNNIKCCDDYKSNFDYILHICKILTNVFVLTSSFSSHVSFYSIFHSMAYNILLHSLQLSILFYLMYYSKLYTLISTAQPVPLFYNTIKLEKFWYQHYFFNNLLYYQHTHTPYLPLNFQLIYKSIEQNWDN